jgi:class 3 adenylate cyclase
MMSVMQWIEGRVALPGDSETFRSQKKLAAIVLFVAAVATLVNGLRYQGQNLDQIAWLFYLVAGLTVLGFILLLTVPRHFEVLAVTLLSASMVLNTAAQLVAGGYTSGLLIIQWAIIILVFAVIFLKRNQVLILTLVYILLMLVAGFLEPRVAQHVVELDPRFLAVDATSTMLLMGLLVAGTGLYLFGRVEYYRRRSDDLLLTILPGAIAQQLKEHPGTIADGYNEVTVLFADIVDFTTMSATADPVDVVSKLNEIFSDFDRLAAKHGLEKIKTIGDAYMVAGGLPQPRADHCQAVVAFALDMLAAMEAHHSWDGRPMQLRVGVNTGPVVAGVIGQQKFIYDLWGDAVNVASRMESNGLASRVQVTQAVKDKLQGLYEFEPRGPIPIKGKGPMVTYIVVSHQLMSDS